jgi:hypothetical protein
MRTVLLIGILFMLVCLSRRPSQAGLRLQAQLRNGWQKLFYVAGFVGAVLIVLNPEFLALGFLGDAAFFDLLVFALSLQFQAAVLGAWRWVRDASPRALSFMVYRLERDWIAIAITLASLRDFALNIRETIRRISWALA